MKSRIQQIPPTEEPEREVVGHPQEDGKSGPRQWTHVRSLKSLVMGQVVLEESCGPQCGCQPAHRMHTHSKFGQGS